MKIAGIVLLVLGLNANTSFAANVWDGGGANDNWGTPQNWDNDLVPSWPQAITFSGTTRLTPNNNLTSITVNGITFDSTAGAYIIGGNAFALGGDITDNSASAERINNGLALGGTRNVNVPTGGSLTLGGTITGAGSGITKIGDGTLTLLGANSYSGNTSIGSTTANGGTIILGAGATLGNGTGALRLGGFQINGTLPVPGTGAPAFTTVVISGVTQFPSTNGNLDLAGNSATLSSLVASGNFTSVPGTVDSINVSPGQTFTVTGNVLVGGMATTSTASGNILGNLTTTLKVTGGGNLKFGSGAGGFFEVWNRSANNNNTANSVSSIFDASAAASFTADYGNGGQILIGASAGDAPYGTLIMGGNDTLIASTLQVGVNGITSGSSANRGGGTLRLGSTNLIRADSILVGSGKASLTTTTANGGGYGVSGSTSGSLMIFDNQAGTGQTAVFRAQDGVGRINSFTISDQSLYSSNGSTGGTGFVDFTGGSVDALINSLRIGIGKSGQNSASSTGTLIFNAGTVDANSIIIAQRSTTSATAGAPATGTVTVGGGTLIAGAGGIRIADTTLTGGFAGATTGTLNILNTGVVQLGGNITGGNSAAAPLATSTINLGLTTPSVIPGGTLNMQGHDIASYAKPLTAINVNSGSIINAATIAAKTISISAGATFSGAPFFVLPDLAGTSFSAPSPFTLLSGGGLGGGGNVNFGAINTDIVAASGSKIAPGSSTVPGTLQVASNVTLNSGSTVRFKLSGNVGAGNGNDLINNFGNLTLGSTVNLEIGFVGTGPQVGNQYTVVTYGGTLTGSAANFNVIQPGSRPTFTVDTSTAGQVNILVGGNPTQSLKYIGNVNSNWDLNTTANWQNPTPAADKFFNLDNVTFDDTSTNLNDVQLVGTLSPATVTVNAGRNYTFAGSGSIGSGAITKSGTGTLTVATNNTTSVDTTINAGTLQLGNGGTTGSLGTGNVINNGAVVINHSDDLNLSSIISGTGTVQKVGTNTLTLSGANTYTGNTTISGGTVVVTNATPSGSSLGDTATTPANVIVASGAAVDLAGSNTGNGLNFGQKNFKISGTGVGGTGAITNSGATGQQNALQLVTLTGNATLGGTGRFDLRDPIDDNVNVAQLDLAGFTLTKEGTNQISLVHTNVTAGDIVVNAGIFSIEGSSSVPAALKPDNVTPYSLTYNTGTTLQVFLQNSGDTFNLSRQVVTNGAVTIRNNGALALTIASPIKMNGDITFTANAAGSGLTMTGDIVQQGTARSLIKQSANTVTLNGLGNYTGPTAIQAGVLALGADNRINDASNLVLSAAGTTAGTFNSGGFNETMNQIAVTTAAASTAMPHIDLGFSQTNTLHFSPSGNVIWSILPANNGSVLSIDNWAQGANHIFVGDQPYAVGSTTMGLSTTQLSRITFTGHGVGATLIAGGELVPQDSVGVTIQPFLLGDFNLNNIFDIGDVTAMLNAMTDLKQFKTVNHLFDSDLVAIGDFNNDGAVTNADIQGILNAAGTAGFGSVSAVPEPSAIALSCVGLLAFAGLARSRRAKAAKRD